MNHPIFYCIFSEKIPYTIPTAVHTFSDEDQLSHTMAPLNIILADWSFIHAPNVTAGLHQFIAERNLAAGYISSHAHEILEWISQPRTSL